MAIMLGIKDGKTVYMASTMTRRVGGVLRSDPELLTFPFYKGRKGIYAIVADDIFKQIALSQKFSFADVDQYEFSLPMYVDLCMTKIKDILGESGLNNIEKGKKYNPGVFLVFAYDEGPSYWVRNLYFDALDIEFGGGEDYLSWSKVLRMESAFGEGSPRERLVRAMIRVASHQAAPCFPIALVSNDSDMVTLIEKDGSEREVPYPSGKRYVEEDK